MQEPADVINTQLALILRLACNIKSDSKTPLFYYYSSTKTPI